MRKYIIVGFLVFGLGFAGWAWVTLKFAYARGERAGYLQKISKKGWVFKTWEGELAMANLPGTMPEIFKFTVREESVAQDLMARAGQRVSLGYEQHRGVPGTAFGETQYFIVKVTPMTDAFQIRPETTGAPHPAK